MNALPPPVSVPGPAKTPSTVRQPFSLSLSSSYFHPPSFNLLNPTHTSNFFLNLQAKASHKPATIALMIPATSCAVSRSHVLSTESTDTAATSTRMAVLKVASLLLQLQ